MGLTREEACKKAQIIDFQGGYTIALVTEIYHDHEAQLKSKDEEIDRIKEIINTSIEEIEYAIIKPQYAEVYLNNAIRFLKDNK